MSKLDLSKLTNLRPAPGGGHSAACPICRAAGSDNAGNHLRLWRDGSFTCVVAKSDARHNAEILKLVGSGVNGEASAGAPQDESSTALDVDVPQVWDTSILDRLVKDHSYWKGRGISEETVAPFRGGVAMEGQMAGRYVFPIFNGEEQIIGFTGRATDPKTQIRWRHLGSTRQWIWGGLDDIASGGRIVLVESIGDSLALREHGVPESICLFGVNLSQAVYGHLLSVNPGRIIVSTNRDHHGIGQAAAEKIRNSLTVLFNPTIVEVILPPEGGPKDWGASTKEQIQHTFLT